MRFDKRSNSGTHYCLIDHRQMIRSILLILIVLFSGICLVVLLEAVVKYAQFLEKKREYLNSLQDFFISVEKLDEKYSESLQNYKHKIKEKIDVLEDRLNSTKSVIKEHLILAGISGVLSITFLIIYDFAYGGKVVRNFVGF